MRIAAVLVILVLAAILAGAHFIASFYFGPKLNAPRIRLQSLTPRILADLKTLESNAPFPDSQYQRDAQPYLIKYVSWEGSGESIADSDRVREVLTRHLYWKNAPGELKSLMEEAEFKALDTKWMEGLLEFDHWNLTSNEKVRARLEDMNKLDGVGRIGVFSSMVMPNYIELRHWGTLHVLKGHQAGRAEQAMPVFRKAAELAHSSGTLVGHMVAVTMLKDELLFKDVFKLKNWKTFPVEAIDSYQRVSWAWVGVALETWRSGFPEALKSYMYPRFGACTAVWELGALGFADFLENRFLFETDFSEHFGRARAHQLELSKLCSLPALESAWHGTAHQGTMSQIPYLRRIIGLNLMTMAVPDFFQIYDRKK